MHVALTGGSTGIGAATAAKLKSQGATITAFDISEPTENVDRWIKVDMSDPASIQAAIDAAAGPFDALINNAGLPPREGLEAVILKVNFVGMRMFLDGMLDQLKPGSAIVNTASRAGAQWMQNIAEVKELMALGSHDDVDAFVTSKSMDHMRAYNLSKEAVIVLNLAMTEALIARNLRMNSVCPAAVATGILDDFTSAFGPRVAKNIERAGRPGTPEEVADIICFLAGPDSAWLMGIDITIDGGMSAMAMSDMLLAGE